MLNAASSHACTNLIVGKKASKDGSVIVSYSCDDYGAYGFMNFLPHAKHGKGEMRALYHYETNNYLGEIPEAEETSFSSSGAHTAFRTPYIVVATP